MFIIKMKIKLMPAAVADVTIIARSLKIGFASIYKLTSINTHTQVGSRMLANANHKNAYRAL